MLGCKINIPALHAMQSAFVCMTDRMCGMWSCMVMISDLGTHPKCYTSGYKYLRFWIISSKVSEIFTIN
jgi:hypothetical protein